MGLTVEDNKADQIFQSTPDKLSEIEEEKNEKYNEWLNNTINTTMNSLPKQIANSRFKNPNKKWIKIGVGSYNEHENLYWNDSNLEYNGDDHYYISRNKKHQRKKNILAVVQHLNDIGFEAELCDSQIISGLSAWVHNIKIHDINTNTNSKASKIFKSVPDELEKMEKYKESLISNRDERNKRIATNAIDKLPKTIAKSRSRNSNERWIYVWLRSELFDEHGTDDDRYLNDYATKDDMAKIYKYINDAGFKTRPLNGYNTSMYIRDPDVKFLGIL